MVTKFLPWLPTGFCAGDRDQCLPLISVPVIVGVDLVANDATDYGPTDCSNRATIRQDGARDATDAGADCRVLVLL
jgi:hypothetical protein